MTDTAFYSFALGVGTKNRKGEWLEVYYPQPLFQPNPTLVELIGRALGYQGGNDFIEVSSSALSKLMPLLKDERQQTILTAMVSSDQARVITFIEEDRELSSTPETYLKLHLLSHRFVKPNQQNLDGIYALLANVAWTDRGAVDLDDLFEIQLQARMRGEIVEVASVDKFPKMTNYVVPTGVRIAHSARVRLGAYLGEGTTVMHEGFVNFNAAAIGPGMIEGRISQGVIIEAGSDLGGSASTAGTLSGGGNIVLTIGKDCLISANAGTGIPLGDRCTIEAGLYITPGTLVQVLDEEKRPVKVVKARELAGQSDMLFIRNSQTGTVECRTNKKAISLNEALHANN